MSFELVFLSLICLISFRWMEYALCKKLAGVVLRVGIYNKKVLLYFGSLCCVNCTISESFTTPSAVYCCSVHQTIFERTRRIWLPTVNQMMVISSRKDTKWFTFAIANHYERRSYMQSNEECYLHQPMSKLRFIRRNASITSSTLIKFWSIGDFIRLRSAKQRKQLL